MANRDVLARFYEEINAGNTDVIEDLIAEDVVGRHPLAPSPDREGVRQFFTMVRAGFPDMQFRILHIVGEDDLVIGHGLIEGTHEGEFIGIAPTHRRVSVPFTDVVRFRNGRMVEHWAVTDTGAMMEQLGAAPARTR